jgi:segregation and condensation protein A
MQSSVPAYRVKFAEFEGPLELLLHLIERAELDITQVSLASIADEYLAYVAEQEEIPLENLAQFLSVASRLILIKSRALLPILEFTEEEEASMEDLEAHLRVYQEYRTAAAQLGVLFGLRRAVSGRESFLGVESVFYPPKSVTPRVLAAAFRNVLGTLPMERVLPEAELARIVTLEERIFHLKETLAERAESSFHEWLGTEVSRVDMIVSFLAMLELIKGRYLEVEQGGLFTPITMRRISLSA